MKTTYRLQLLQFGNIKELPNAWTKTDYIKLLDELGFDEATSSPEEIKDLCMMALSDNDPEDSAALVLRHIFRDKLSDGQIKNLSYEIFEEKLWEEYADVSFHEQFFNVTQLLYDAYNGKFPYPVAVEFKVKIFQDKTSSLDMLGEKPETKLIQLLVQGMPENTLLKRLFYDELVSGDFEEAKDIIWQMTEVEKTNNHVIYKVISSSYWFHDLKYVESFNALLDSPVIMIN